MRGSIINFKSKRFQISRDSLLDRENTIEEQSKITFNYPVFQNVKNILAKLDL